MTYYCTNCWNEIKPGDKICPFCGANQNILEKENYEEKLIRALGHPEPATPVRAAGILAVLNSKMAVPVLLKELEDEKDPFKVEAFVRAVLRICPEMKKEVKKIIGKNIPVSIRELMGGNDI